jgi:hypothetical protein
MGNPKCEKLLKEIFAKLPPTIPYFSWPWGDKCEKWGFACEQALNSLVFTADLNVEVIRLNYVGPNKLWTAHVIVKITLPNGIQFYADHAWLGGADHLFFEEIFLATFYSPTPSTGTS